MSESDDDFESESKGKSSTKKGKASKNDKTSDAAAVKKKKPKAAQAPKEISGKTPEEIEEDQTAKHLLKKARQIGVLSTRRESSKNHLRPSAIIRKHTQSKPLEIFKKAVARKNKALLVFPGLVATIKEGKLGQLSNMHRNPTLDVEFPNGTLRLKGTRVNTKQKFLTIQPKARKLLMQDVFDHLVVFVEQEWTGKPEDNPVKHPPEPIHKGFSFEGGASDSTRGDASIHARQKSIEGSQGKQKDSMDMDDHKIGSQTEDGQEASGRLRRSVTAKPLRYTEKNSDDDGSDADSDDDDDFAAEADDSGTRSPVRALPLPPMDNFNLDRVTTQRSGGMERKKSVAAKVSSDEDDDAEIQPKAKSSAPRKSPAATPGKSPAQPAAKGQQSIMAFVKSSQRAAESDDVIDLGSDDDAPKPAKRAAAAAKPRAKSAGKARKGGSSDEDGGDDDDGDEDDAPKHTPAKRGGCATPRARGKVKSYKEVGSDDESEESSGAESSGSDGAPRKKASKGAAKASKAPPSAKKSPAPAKKAAAAKPAKAKSKRKLDDSDDDDDGSSGGDSGGSDEEDAAPKKKKSTPAKPAAARKPAAASTPKKGASAGAGKAASAKKSAGGDKKKTPAAGKKKKSKKGGDSEDEESSESPEDDDDDDWDGS